MILSFAAAVLLLAVALIVIARGRNIPSVSLALGLGVLGLITVLDQAALSQPENLLAWKRWVIFAKSLLPPAFLVYGITYSRKRLEGMPPMPAAALGLLALGYTAATLLFPTRAFFGASQPDPKGMLPLGPVGYWFYLAQMIACIMALVSLERTFLSAKGLDRWKMKFEFLGAAGFLGSLIFYFSQGLLFRAIDMGLLPVRSSIFIVSALMIGFSRLSRGTGARVSVSRYVVYRSLTLFLVGGYFLSLGLLGEGVKRLGITFSQGLTALAGLLMGLIFLMIFFSEELRRRVKVFINKHFYAHKHDYRDAWLLFSAKLAHCRTINDVQNAVLESYAKSFGLKSTALYLPGPHGSGTFHLAATQGREDMPQTACISADLLAHFSEHGRVINPVEKEYQPTAEETAFFKNAGARLIVPLMAGERVEGLVILGSSMAPEELTWEDYDLMKTMAQQAAQSLMNYRLSEELAESRELAAVAKVSSFIVHDLKNVSSSFNLLLDNAVKYISRPEFQKDLIDSLRSSVAKMQGIIGKLKAFPTQYRPNFQNADLGELASEAAREIKGRKQADIKYNGFSATCPMDAPEIKKVVENLLLNALDAVDEEGDISISGGEGDGMAFVAVSDNGAGISDYFIKNHLFKPFRTTKDKGLGIGLYQCRQIIEAHGGRIEVQSVVGKGTTFTVLLPQNR